MYDAQITRKELDLLFRKNTVCRYNINFLKIPLFDPARRSRKAGTDPVVYSPIDGFEMMCRWRIPVHEDFKIMSAFLTEAQDQDCSIILVRNLAKFCRKYGFNTSDPELHRRIYSALKCYATSTLLIVESLFHVNSKGEHSQIKGSLSNLGTVKSFTWTQEGQELQQYRKQKDKIPNIEIEIRFDTAFFMASKFLYSMNLDYSRIKEIRSPTEQRLYGLLKASLLYKKYYTNAIKITIQELSERIGYEKIPDLKNFKSSITKGIESIRKLDPVAYELGLSVHFTKENKVWFVEFKRNSKPTKRKRLSSPEAIEFC